MFLVQFRNICTPQYRSGSEVARGVASFCLATLLLSLGTVACAQDNYTVTHIPGDVYCAPGVNTQLMSFTPGWSYQSGISNIGTDVRGFFEVENTTNHEATGLSLQLHQHNDWSAPFSVPAHTTVHIFAFAADGFSPPTNWFDYSPFLYVAPSSLAGVVVHQPRNNNPNLFFSTHTW